MPLVAVGLLWVPQKLHNQISIVQNWSRQPLSSVHCALKRMLVMVQSFFSQFNNLSQASNKNRLSSQAQGNVYGLPTH